ncbi:hypothetical protein VMCG_02042 [Cytospora schulzeri]|uniref:Uncharacterized protein n=1 Tax=Cytospora schulzeri TaxID=448051 RepID=A0A423X393_9PEZI|nr:hypothetical protein VMCG_02042 [Valsa malicola]
MSASSPDDHIQALSKEIDQLHNELAMIKLQRKDINKATRDMIKGLKKASNKHKKLNRSYEKHKEEMWFAILAGNTAIATKAEQKLKRVIEEQAQLQRSLPDQYKSGAGAIKMMIESKAKRFEWQLKIALKEEEMHRFKPCVSVTCKHCKRIDTTALQKAKVAFKDGVMKMLKAKVK